MTLSEEIEKVAQTREDPKTIASIVGARYDGKDELIADLVEEILFLRGDWNPGLELFDAYGKEGPVVNDEEEKRGFDVEFPSTPIRYYQFGISFKRPEEERRLIFEQNGDDIRVECITSNPNPDATLFLREDCTEIHAVIGKGGHRYTGNRDSSQSPVTHVHNRPDNQ